MIETQIDIKLSCAFPSFSSPDISRNRLGDNIRAGKEREFIEKGERKREGREWHKRQRRSGECTEGGGEYVWWMTSLVLFWLKGNSHELLSWALVICRSQDTHWNLILKRYFPEMQPPPHFMESALQFHLADAGCSRPVSGWCSRLMPSQNEGILSGFAIDFNNTGVFFTLLHVQLTICNKWTEFAVNILHY